MHRRRRSQPTDPGVAARARFILLLAAVCGLTMVAGCGTAISAAGAQAAYADAGVTFQLPPGWVKGDNLHYQRGLGNDHLGLVMVMPLNGQTLDQYVTTAARQSGDVAGRRSLRINRHDAIELLLESDYDVYELYIQRGDEVVYLSFRTLPKAFDAQFAAFRAAGQSVRFQ